MVAAIIGYLFGVIGLSFTAGGLFMENPVLEKSVILDFKIGCGFSLARFPISSDGFGNVVFFLELGRTFMSGRNDSPVFSNLSTLSGFYEIKLVPPLNSRELFFLSLVRSKPPPVINYFLALLYCYYRSFASSCYLICFLSASSALLCVYFLLSSSSIYFLIFSSANLCL